jgi:ABC-type glycerol-3-phosphate transport system permease component
MFPLYWMLVTSVQDTGQLFRFPPRLIPTDDLTLEPYFEAFRNSDLGLWLVNSLKVAFGTALIAIVIGSLAAYALSRFSFRGKGLTALALLGTQMFPGVLIVLPMYLLFAELGLLDSLTGLTIAYLAFLVPVATTLLKGFFDAIPVELEHASMIDGASRLRSLWDIVLPLSLPGLIASFFFVFIIAWDEYLFARALLTSEETWTVSLGLASYFGEYTTPWDQVMSSALLITLPVALLFLVLQRYLLRGLTAGAIRG